MLYWFVCLLLIGVSVVALRSARVSNPYSKGMLLTILFSLVTAVCLAQNYTQSLIPEVNDGIGISNQVAYWIIGEDGWSKDIFRTRFEASLYLTFAAIVLYPLILIAESRFMKVK